MPKRNIRHGRRVGRVPFMTLTSKTYSFSPPTIPSGSLLAGQVFNFSTSSVLSPAGDSLATAMKVTIS